MNIGFVSVWFERGAGYVTRSYLDIHKSDNNVYVYARAGEVTDITPGWDQDFVTWGKVLPYTRISWNHFKKWIVERKLDVIFFNEQRDFQILYLCKLYFPNVKLGTYIDYYKVDMVPEFKYYDFLVCNTKRHYSAFSWHKQAYYIPWGTDVDLYKPVDAEGKLVEDNRITFFHSAGMATRKGTDVLIDTFVNSDLWQKSKLVLHTQIPVSKFTRLTAEDLMKKSVVIIEKTVKAPGLYYMGDVYVYPTTLDGLGLTMYEALSSGLPVITSDNAPMNEVIDDSVGSLVSIDRFISREDGYYWPLCYVNKSSLYEKMKECVDNPDVVMQKKLAARQRALAELDFSKKGDAIRNAFIESEVLPVSKDELLNAIKATKKKSTTTLRMSAEMLLPANIVDFSNKLIKVIKHKK